MFRARLAAPVPAGPVPAAPAFMAALAMAVLAGGCSDSAKTTVSDAAVAPVPDAACGLACATWIEDYERDVVYKLAGATPISEGVVLEQRYSQSQRETTRGFLEAELEAHGLAPQRHGYGSGAGANIFAELAATSETRETIVVGAHFDSVQVSPGAGDDGTGTALVLSAARYFASQPERRANYIFAFFDQEELGLVGSRAFASKLIDDATDVSAVHIFDLVSWDEDEDSAIELWSPAPQLQALYELVGAEYGIPVQSVEFASSDHTSFIEAGFDAVGASEEFVGGDFNPNYHTAGDTADQVNYAYLARMTEFAIDVLSRAP